MARKMDKQFIKHEDEMLASRTSYNTMWTCRRCLNVVFTRKMMLIHFRSKKQCREKAKLIRNIVMGL